MQHSIYLMDSDVTGNVSTIGWVNGLCAKIRECEEAARNGDVAAALFPWAWMNPIRLEIGGQHIDQQFGAWEELEEKGNVAAAAAS